MRSPRVMSLIIGLLITCFLYLAKPHGDVLAWMLHSSWRLHSHGSPWGRGLCLEPRPGTRAHFANRKCSWGVTSLVNDSLTRWEAWRLIRASDPSMYKFVPSLCPKGLGLASLPWDTDPRVVFLIVSGDHIIFPVLERIRPSILWGSRGMNFFQSVN